MSRRNKFRAIDNETIKLYDRVTKIETDVLAKFIALKKQKAHFQCPHLELRQECEPYQPFSDYYSRFWKTFLTARLNQSRIEILKEEVGDLKKEI